MKICGVKLTHDAAVAVLEDGVLTGCVEIEKMANNPRYTAMRAVRQVEEALALLRISVYDIDHWALDGWKTPHVMGYPVAPYHEHDREPSDLLTRYQYRAGTASYAHVGAHVMAAYATSPFAKTQCPAYALVWDGGMQPRVYYVHPPMMRAERIGQIGELYGTLYSLMGLYFGPYKRQEVIDYQGCDYYTLLKTYCNYGLAGKLMAYIGDGATYGGRYSFDYLVAKMEAVHADLDHKMNLKRNTLEYDNSREIDFQFLRGIYRFATEGYHDKIILAAIHVMCERMLVRGIQRLVPEGAPLCFTGGAALNIKWNSAIRRAGYPLWVPPFPNDCGNAIGAAVCEQVFRTGRWHIEWDVYSGPPLLPLTAPVKGWSTHTCSMVDLARHLFTHAYSPTVVLMDRAELGPRALGHRSVFTSPFYEANKIRLNAIKQREDFRPVAPICLESDADRYFSPGTPDPYMLFDHEVREGYRHKLPAITHTDGTARLQTINRRQDPQLHELLSEFQRLSGFPILCNTSANDLGKGFFPDVRSAMEWGGVDYVWANGFLYSREE